MNRPIFYWLVLVAITISLAMTSLTHTPTQAQGPATDPSQLDLKALIQQADLILIGLAETVSSQYSTNQYNDQLIVSNVSIKPEEVLKGEMTGGNLIMQNLLGGTVGDISMAADGSLFFRQGQQVVLFMEAGSNGPEVIDDELGKFDVDNAGQVPELGISLAQFRSDILSYLPGSQIYLPLILKNAQSSPLESDSGPAPVQPQETGAILPLFVPTDSKWPGSSPVVEYLINNPGFNDATAGTVAEQNVAIRNGALTWFTQGRSNFRFDFGGTTTTSSVDADGENVVIVRNAPSGGALATANWWWNRANETTDCDIVFWDQNNNFSVTGAAHTYDIQWVATHEFGHCLGLHHVRRGPTMHGTTYAGTTYGRTLHLDDMRGINFLYGTSLIFDDQKPSGVNEAGDRFGSSLAVADFYSDGLSLPDLAVGAPGEDLGTGSDAGAVYLFSYGGSTFYNLARLTQSDIGTDEAGDRFGAALAVGHFNADSWPDLVVGAPGEDFPIYVADTGIVYLFFGNGNGVGSPVLVRQEMADSHEMLDQFGTALAVGDFNNDGRDDLAVGAPGEAVGGSGFYAGAVFYYLGKGDGLSPPLMLTQTGVDINEGGDEFGSALAVGDFNGDDYDDLAIGAPGEDYLGSGPDAGVFYVFYGSALGLDTPVVFGQESVGTNEAGDEFGSSLAAGDFNGDGFADLAVGAPGEDVAINSAVDAGMGLLFYGSGLGLGAGGEGPVPFYPEIPSTESGDHFAATLAAGDFNRDGLDDLAIGVPGEDLGAASDAGKVVIRQFADDSGRNQNFTMDFDQEPAGVNESGDRFGSALTVFSYVEEDLLIGAPGKSLSGSGADTGTFFFWH